MTDAAIVIVRDDLGRVLTVSRPEPPYEMAIPGGHIDDGETASEAAVRELKEETGLTIVALRHVKDVTSPTDGSAVSVFVADSWTGEAYAVEPNTRVAWMAPTDLLSQSRLFRSTVIDLMGARLLSDKTPAVTMDLGTADVSTPSAGGGATPAGKNSKARKRRRAARDLKRRLAKSLRVRADIARGGSLNIRHMSEQVAYVVHLPPIELPPVD